MIKKSSILLLLVSICAFFLCGQGFETAVNISKSSNPSKWGGIAFGPDGLVHICWEEDYLGAAGADIYYAHYDGSKWTKLKLTEDKTVDKKYPDIEVGKDGTIAVVWEQKEMGHHYIYMREYSPTQGKWLSVVKISDDYWGNFPKVCIDSEGNIFCSFFAENGGDSFSRSRINGKWEVIYSHSRPFATRSTQTEIAVTNDDRVYMLFRLKNQYKEYKIHYTYRTAKTNWFQGIDANDSGASQGRISMAIDPDNIPWIYYQDKAASQGEIWSIKLDLKTNPREMYRGLGLTHFPCGAFSSDGTQYVAWQIGSYDRGKGIIYRYRLPGGSMSPEKSVPQSDLSSLIPKMDADDFGNVGIVWDSESSYGEKDIWFSSTLPVIQRGLKPPENLTINLSVDSLGLKTQVTYHLGWQRNPNNDIDKLKGYNLYRKSGDGDYELFEELGKDDLNRQVVIQQDFERYKFALTSVSLTNYESKKVEFLPEEE